MLAVDAFGSGRAGVADKASDVLDRNTRVRHQRDEAVPQLARCPVCGVKARSGENGTERTADVPSPERGAQSGGKHQVVIVPPVPRSLTDLVLTAAVEKERVDAAGLTARARPEARPETRAANLMPGIESSNQAGFNAS